MKAKLLIAFGIIVSMALAVVWASPHSSEATTFRPEQGAILFSSLAVGANPDITTDFNVTIASPASANFTGQFGGAITFEDGAVAHAADGAVPDGAYMGELTSVATLGLANSGCFNPTPVSFQFVDATTSDTNIITPSGPASNLLANMSEDDGDLDNNGTVELPAFANNGIPDGADAYPDFVRDSLDPDGPGGAPPIVPRARYFGTAFVAGSLIVLLQLVVLDPGAVAVIPDLSWANTDFGFPSATFLNNPLAPASNSAISDFCNFSSQTTLFGFAHDNSCTPSAGAPAFCTATGSGFTLRLAVDGGCPTTIAVTNECDPDGDSVPNFPRVTLPGSSQTISWRQWAVSQRDWDQGATPPQAGDGISTNLDPCPTHPFGRGSVDSWDPRAVFNVEDTDTIADGIPNTSSVGNGLSCDPTASSTSFDEDGDGWDNRLDNCPRLANGSFNTGTPGLTAGVGAGATGITVTSASGSVNPVGFVVGDVISITEGVLSDTGLVLTGVAGSVLTFAGDPTANAYTTAAIVAQQSHASNTGQFDLDIALGIAGGVPDDGPRTDIMGAPCDPNPTAINGHYHATMITKNICVGTVTSDCSAAIDTDGDSVFNENDNCIGGANALITGFSQSQRDLNADGFADIADIVLLAGKFGTEGGNPTAAAGYEGRLDLNYDRFVDIGDIVLEAGVFGATC